MSTEDSYPSDENGSGFQKLWVEISARTGHGATMPTWEEFSERFDRCFRHLALYVGRHESDRNRFRQIVTEVLKGSLDLFMAPSEQRDALQRLNASADRLLTARSGDSAW